MTTFLLILAGIVVGYRLPPLVRHVRRIVRRQRFKPVLLRPYDPTAEETGSADRREGRT